MSETTGTWIIDPAQTTVTVTAKNFFVKSVPGTIAVSAGQAVDTDGAATISTTLDATSYASGNEKRDEHVLGSDFFDAEAFPEITFESSSVTAQGSGYDVAGMVGMKGTSAPLSLAVSDVSISGDSASFRAAGTVARSAVGVSKMPSMMIGKDIEITIEGAATRSA